MPLKPNFQLLALKELHILNFTAAILAEMLEGQPDADNEDIKEFTATILRSATYIAEIVRRGII